MAHDPFSLSVLLGDPFAFSTVSIALIAWIIAFAGSIAADIDSQHSKFPVFTWWGIVFELLVITLIFYVICANALHIYRFCVIGFLATATVYTTNSTNNFVWNGTPASGAVAAGHILLSIINIIWLFYFGTSEEQSLHSFIDSFAVSKGGSHSSRQMAHGNMNNMESINMHGGNSPNRNSNPFNTLQSDNFHTGASASHNNVGTYNPTQHQQMFTSSQLEGFENSSDHNRNSILESKNMSYISDGNATTNGTGLDNGRSTGTVRDSTGALSTPTDYPYRARAVYSYTANPADDNEISFHKDEILEVSDITGKWWQARRNNGEVGICPSNYVVLEQ